MSADLLREVVAYLVPDGEDHAGKEFLERLGDAGVERLIRQMEADYAQAARSLELSGRDVARIAALSHIVATTAGITSEEGRDTVKKLLETGWLMARWYERD